MDPNKIQLTTLQKIKPLLKAINDEIPYQFVIIIGIALTAAVMVPTYIPALFNSTILDFIVRRVIIGGSIAIISFFSSGFLYMFIVEKIAPLFKKINEHYQKHALEEKKKILDNVIEDEVLGVEK